MFEFLIDYLMRSILLPQECSIDLALSRWPHVYRYMQRPNESKTNVCFLSANISKKNRSTHKNVQDEESKGSSTHPAPGHARARELLSS